MNKKAIFGMGIVAIVSLIVIASIGLAFGFIFGIDILARGGGQEQVIKNLDGITNSREVILDCLNTKVNYNEKEIDISDLIILSVKEKNYAKLEEELKKSLNLPKTWWSFEIDANKRRLLYLKREGWNPHYFEEDKLGKTVHKLDLITPLSEYPELNIVFKIKEGYKI